ncbi:GAP1-M domain-containing protein [Actinokineospora sp. NPDC004072]
MLPRVTGSVTAPIPDAVVAAFLAEGERSDHLAALVAAVQTGLVEHRPTVLVCPQEEVLVWLTAVSRSFPREVALRITFLTRASGPPSQDVVLSCATSAPRVPAVVCDVGAAPSDRLTPYAAALRRSWSAGWSREQASVSIGLADLDAVAEGLAAADEPILLRVAARRNAALWPAVLDGVARVGMTELEPWLALVPDAPAALARHCLDAIVARGVAQVPRAAVPALRDGLAELPGPTAWRLRPEVAAQLAHPPAPRAVEVALARHGRHDRVAVTRRYAEESPADLPALGRVLWAEPPDHAETGPVLDLPDDVLRDTGLIDHLVAQIRALRDERVGSRLSAVSARVLAVAPDLTDVDRAVIEAIRCLDTLGGRAPLRRTAATAVGPALELAGVLPGLDRTGLARRLRSAVETRLRLVADAGAAAAAVRSALDSDQIRAFEVVAVRALSAASPETVGVTFTAWTAMNRCAVRDRLLHDRLPVALRDRSADFLASVPVPDDRKADWSRWRARHRRRSVLSRLFSRG